MGYNTVVFLLNDMMHTIKDSPHIAAFMIAHPPMGESDRKHLLPQYASVAKDHNELGLSSQAIHVLPTFHADDMKFLAAGQNDIKELTFRKFAKTKDGKYTVTLEVPEYMVPERLRKK